MDIHSFAKSVVGKPYLDFGRGPDRYDCVGILLACFQAVLKVELPDPATDDNYKSGGISLLSSFFDRLPFQDGLKPLDVLHFRRQRQHVAVIEDSRWALHTTEEQVVRSRIADIVGPRTLAYRLKPCSQ